MKQLIYFLVNGQKLQMPRRYPPPSFIDFMFMKSKQFEYKLSQFAEYLFQAKDSFVGKGDDITSKLRAI